MRRAPSGKGLPLGADAYGHCASVAALVDVMARALEYHGPMAAPFGPLGRHGLVPGLRGRAASADDWLRTFEEVHAQYRDLEERIRLRTHELTEAHARSERLLRNIVPGPIAERLEASPATIADAFDDVSVAFTDLVGFTPLAASMSPTRLVGVLDDVFRQFDAIAERYGVSAHQKRPGRIRSPTRCDA